MKITHNAEPKEFKPFSITITFESKQEAINFLHYTNASGTNKLEMIMNEINYDYPSFDCQKGVGVDHHAMFRNLLQSKDIIP